MNYWQGSNRKWESEYMKDEFQAVVSWGLSQTLILNLKKMNFWNCILRDFVPKNWERIYFFCTGTLLLLFIWFTFDIWERGTSEVHFLCLLADSQSPEDGFFLSIGLTCSACFCAVKKKCSYINTRQRSPVWLQARWSKRILFFCWKLLVVFVTLLAGSYRGFSLRKKKKKGLENKTSL